MKLLTGNLHEPIETQAHVVRYSKHRPNMRAEVKAT
jgi:hypothetical protein